VTTVNNITAHHLDHLDSLRERHAYQLNSWVGCRMKHGMTPPIRYKSTLRFGFRKHLFISILFLVIISRTYVTFTPSALAVSFLAKRIHEDMSHPEHYRRLKEQRVREEWTCCLSMKPFKWALIFKLFLLAFAFANHRCVSFSCSLLVCKRPVGRPRRRWVDNIRMDLQEVGCGYMDWIGLGQDRDRWRTLVSAVMNLRVPW